MILTKTSNIFLYFTANTWYNSAKTDLIHEGGCLVDEKLSLSSVKIVQHSPLTLCFRQHKKYSQFKEEFAGAQKCWTSVTDATAKSTHLSDADIVLSMFIVYTHVIPSKCALIYLFYSAVNTVFCSLNASMQNRGVRVVKATAVFNGRVVYRLRLFRRGRTRNVICSHYI